jgi:hypothetical protein
MPTFTRWQVPAVRFSFLVYTVAFSGHAPRVTQGNGAIPAIISKDKTGMSPYGSNGVDVTLIRWMLSLTPAERLAVLQDFADFIEEVKAANATQSAPSCGRCLTIK